MFAFGLRRIWSGPDCPEYETLNVEGGIIRRLKEDQFERTYESGVTWSVNKSSLDLVASMYPDAVSDIEKAIGI
jgi:hypothetical protein